MPRSPRALSHFFPLRNASGITFVEILVVTSLLAMVLGGILPLLTVGQQTYGHAHPRSDMVQNARIGLDKFIREMRAAQTFQTISSTNIAFTFFLGDGTTSTAEYRLNAATSELEYRRGTDPFQPLAGPFRSMSVSCFDAAGAAIACSPAASVRSVQVALVVMDPQGKIPDITVTSRAFRQTP